MPIPLQDFGIGISILNISSAALHTYRLKRVNESFWARQNGKCWSSQAAMVLVHFCCDCVSLYMSALCFAVLLWEFLSSLYLL